MNKGVISILAAASLLAASACGSSPTASSGSTSDDAAVKATQKVFERFNQMTGTERTDALVKAAEKEGELNLYTSNTDIDDMVDAFSDKYDIDVNVYRANGETVLQRVLQEAKADYRAADLIETDAGELNVMQKEGMLADYESALRDAVRPEGRHDGWTADRFNVFVVAWNTKLVKPGQAPTSLDDLTDPKWKGKVSMEVGDVDWFAAMYKYYQDQGMSEDDIMTLFKKLAAGSKIVKGHTVQGELLSAGQFAVAVSLYSHTVDKQTDDGAPVAWHADGEEPVQPLVIRPNGAGLMRTAEHPAAAMLFIDFLLSDGQDLLAKSFRIRSVPDASDPLAGLQLIEAPQDELLADSKKWDDRYEEVTSGGTSTE
jgi:iron(III) transport system substrate-binding protein